MKSLRFKKLLCVLKLALLALFSLLIYGLKRLEANQSKPRIRKLNMQALRQDIKDYPDAYLYERAARFGVAVNSIWHGLKKLGVTYKKSTKTSQGRRRQTAHIQEQD